MCSTAAPATAAASPGTSNFLTHLPHPSAAANSPVARRFSRAKTGDASPAAAAAPAAGVDRPRWGGRRKSSIVRGAAGMRARGSFSGSVRNLSPNAGRLLDTAKQAKAQKAASVALSLRQATTFKRTDSGRIEIATVKGVKRRTWGFGVRVVAGFRSEHTIGSFLYPQDVETASLTDPQIGQIFWNMVRSSSSK